MTAAPVTSLSDILSELEVDAERAARPLAEVLARLDREVLSDVNRLAHPMYLGHQATVVETQLVRWLTELIGSGPGAGGIPAGAR